MEQSFATDGRSFPPPQSISDHNMLYTHSCFNRWRVLRLASGWWMSRTTKGYHPVYTTSKQKGFMGRCWINHQIISTTRTQFINQIWPEIHQTLRWRKRIRLNPIGSLVERDSSSMYSSGCCMACWRVVSLDACLWRTDGLTKLTDGRFPNMKSSKNALNYIWTICYRKVLLLFSFSLWPVVREWWSTGNYSHPATSAEYE